MENTVKTYGNSFLYNRIPNYEKAIFEYVMKADRINKSSESFSGIIEDVKRRQTTAVISRVLMRDDVVLTIYDNHPMPASFKVFTCKDVKSDRVPRTFIDCTGLITSKNGYFVCNKIDVLCSYLLSAMTEVIYINDARRLVNNSAVIQSGTECFVSLASHIFDYLRVNGYSENRNKISYILAMYFQVSLLGLDREDTSTKNMAAKISGISTRDINAMEIYYTDEDLENIDTILNSIATTFKMKGMTTDVFVEKWNWFYGNGTYFGCELFTAFSSMLTNAYCGSYINNQKSIEKCCGRSMVNFANAIIRVGSDVIDVGFRYESGIERDIRKDSGSVLQEVLFNSRITKEMQIKVDDFDNTSALAKKIKNLAENGFKKDKDRSKNMKSIYLSCIGTVGQQYMGKNPQKTNYNNVISATVKAIKPYLLSNEKQYIINGLTTTVTNLSKSIANKDPNVNTNTPKVLKDCQTALKTLDPSYKITENTVYDKNNIREEVEIPIMNGSVMQGFINKNK
ncbi:MAG: hypothetical protein NC548_15555 [Lachnospiraceae bacterium]|nr:hypothetical protein [Lachnospiraceae bacterium]